jgi:hypothetical protein
MYNCNHLLSKAGSSILAVQVAVAGETSGARTMGEAPKLKGEGGGGFFLKSPAEFIIEASALLA